ncbi:T9SS type A sorting domain-containing protein, partial [bacterium]|nr:T9SS type A sorting domain-containing protein [bacterium]
NGEDITFGSYDGKAWARSSDVVCHEYTHNTIYHIYGEFIHTGYGTEAFAMDEGISDYFASTINGDANHAEDIGGNRTLQNNFSWDPSQPDPVHWNGQVIGGAIWNLRQTVGQNVADNLAFKALQMVPHARSFQQFLENMLVVDGNIYGASHQSQIISAFSAHGINTAPLLVASITGPTNVAQNTSATWYANVSGGTGVYQYEWLKSGVYIGSGSSVSTVVNDVFTLRLKATSGAQTTYATIQVHPDASGGGCPYIFADTETGWIMDNNILHRSEFVKNRGKIIQDFYKLNVIPTKTDHGYKIQIKELNSDHSYLDEFNLYAVDHSPNITIGVTEDNRIVQYLSNDLILADEITFENSENLHSGTNQIKNSKGDMMHVKFSSDKMNRLKTAQFGSASTKQAALFIDFHSFNFSKPPGKESALQVQDNSQLNKSNWMKLEVARREQGSAVIIPLTEDVNLNDIKIHWNRESVFGRIGLVPITDIDSKQLLALKSAMHSKHGDVIRKLNTADNLFSELNESETIDLTFEAPSDLNEKLIRSFILETNGYYVVPGETESVIPKEFGLEQNYPNPFNPTTTIRYNLKENTKVTLTIYNTLGQVVKALVDKEETAGIKNISWDGKDEHGKQVASGVYIYKLKTGNLVFSRKMIFLK